MSVEPEHGWTELQSWVGELDACDGYLVLVGDVDAAEPVHCFGPYPGLVALTAAHQLDTAGTAEAAGPGATVRVVRLHHGRGASGRSTLRNAGSSSGAPRPPG